MHLRVRIRKLWFVKQIKDKSYEFCVIHLFCYFEWNCHMGSFWIMWVDFLLLFIKWFRNVFGDRCGLLLRNSSMSNILCTLIFQKIFRQTRNFARWFNVYAFLSYLFFVFIYCLYYLNVLFTLCDIFVGIIS